ncbi:MAG: NAD(P)H-hydrate dehydratase [Bacteroidales bacterium]|nr:NAD(P)H-hydrate dehydratase [Bacteroidales bacterium]
MKILNTKAFENLLESTIVAENDGGVALIERIASSVAYEIISRWLPKKPFILFAGPGYNGSIALATAQILIEQGYKVEILLFNINSLPITDICRIYRDKIKSIEGVDFTEITTKFDMPYISPDHVVIDGLFGTGLTSPLKGGFAMLIQYINESGAYIVAIDTPSGLLAEWNQSNARSNIIKANLTLALKSKRLSFFFSENEEYIGTCKVIDIDFNLNAYRKVQSNFTLLEEADVRRVLRKRQEYSSKKDYGSMLLVAGSYGMMGAAVLSAKGALRSGVGRLTVHSPRCGFYVLQSAVPEACCNYDLESSVVTEVAIDREYHAIAIGPGLGNDKRTELAIDSLFKRYKKPCIIDADAINAIANNHMLLSCIPPMSVITPHVGEFHSLFGEQPSDESRLCKAISMAKRYKIIIVLKGRHTMIVRPDEKVYINSSGSPALATPGSGDVLTGIIGSLAAQGYEMELCAAMGVFIHGMAGEYAEKRYGSYSVLASDIVDNIGPVIKDIMSRNENL